MGLLDELAAHLAAVVPGLTWRPDGVYAAGEVGIVLETVPQSPDEVVVLGLYAGPESDARNPWDEPSLQVRVRGTGDPRVSRDRAQAIYDQMHGASRVTLPGGTWLQLAVGAQSGPIPLGVDGSNRHEHTVNFRLDVRRPTAHRP